LQDAKSRFSEMLDTTIAEGPQVITKHGKAAAVLVPIRQWEALQQNNKRTLKQLLLAPGSRFDLADKLNIPSRVRLALRKISDQDD
jgi:antitoxin Phd